MRAIGEILLKMAIDEKYGCLANPHSRSAHSTTTRQPSLIVGAFAHLRPISLAAGSLVQILVNIPTWCDPDLYQAAGWRTKFRIVSRATLKTLF